LSRNPTKRRACAVVTESCPGCQELLGPMTFTRAIRMNIFILERKGKTMKMKELQRQIASIFKEYRELREKYSKLMRGNDE
jgi:hypothetical protein